VCLCLCAAVTWSHSAAYACGIESNERQRGARTTSVSEASGPWRMAIAPPSSLSRLNPSIYIPKEGDHRRSPFQAMLPCDLTMLPSSMIVMRRNVIV